MTFHRKLGNVVFILGGLAPKTADLAFIVTNLFLVLALHTAWGVRETQFLPFLVLLVTLSPDPSKPLPLCAFLYVSPPRPTPSFLFLSREVMTANWRPPPGLFPPLHPFLGCTCSNLAQKGQKVGLAEAGACRRLSE